MALRPPVSAISIASGAAVSASWRLDQPGHLGRAGEADAGDARIGGQRRADRRAVAGQKLQHILGNAGLAAAAPRRARQSAASARPAWRCTALPVTRAAAIWPVKIASGKFHGEMQTMAPRASVPASRLGGLGRIVAQEVDRLAHFGDAVGQRLAGLAGGQREELDGVGLVEVGGAVAASPRARQPAVLPRPAAPRQRCATAAATCSAAGFTDRADDIVRAWPG